MASAPIHSGSGKDCVIKFDNFVVGEHDDVDPETKGGVELLGFAWGVECRRDPGGGGGPVGARKYQDVSCTAAVSKASPQLFQACFQNQRLRTVKMYVRKQGAIDKADKSQGKYYIVTLKDAAVTSYRSAIESVSDSSIPVDEFTLSFAEIEFTYLQQLESGGLGGAVSATDSLRGKQ
jgi:type VI secretion system secreted protein Hcp